MSDELTDRMEYTWGFIGSLERIAKTCVPRDGATPENAAHVEQIQWHLQESAAMVRALLQEIGALVVAARTPRRPQPPTDTIPERSGGYL